MVRFVVTSDLHYYTDTECRVDKQRERDAILALSPRPEFVVVSGDITHSAMDGRLSCCIPLPFPGIPNQIGCYDTTFVKPLEQQGIRVYSLAGNHDYAESTNKNARQPMLDYVRRRHGNLYYAFEHTGGLHFVVLGMYPDATARAFLAATLHAANQAALDHGLPAPRFVLFWHFNVTGELSDWFPEADKQATLDVMEPYRAQIAGIFVGHLHMSFTDTWNGYTVHCTGGDRFALVTCCPVTASSSPTADGDLAVQWC
jgi:hypothetical protein